MEKEIIDTLIEEVYEQIEDIRSDFVQPDIDVPINVKRAILGNQLINCAIELMQEDGANKNQMIAYLTSRVEKICDGL